MKKSKKINSKNSTISFETFREIGSYTIGNLKQEKADCFNGLVSIKKYKVTVGYLRSCPCRYFKLSTNVDGQFCKYLVTCWCG